MINGIGQQLDGHLPLLRPATGADGRVVADAADTDPLVLQGAENTQGDLKEVNPCSQTETVSNTHLKTLSKLSKRVSNATLHQFGSINPRLPLP